MGADSLDKVFQAAAEVANAVVVAIHSGDISGLRQLLAKHPGVASAPLGGRYKSRTPLHAVADWPGYFPHGPEIVRLLVDAGADPNARQPGEETPLHWAASSDDWHVAVALIDAGADVNAPDGSIGTPLANAVGYGCWDVARLLVARGPTSTSPGSPLRWACSTGSRRSWVTARPRNRCPKRSGTPAQEANVAPPSTCSAAERTSTGSPTTPKAHRSTPPPEKEPAREPPRMAPPARSPSAEPDG